MWSGRLNLTLNCSNFMVLAATYQHKFICIKRRTFAMLRLYSVLCLLLTFAGFIESSHLNFEARCPGIAIPVCKQYFSPEPDYYWRPYNGEVPDDAIVGGSNSHSNVTYIGQIPITSFAALNPATIYPGNKAASSSYNGIYSHDKDVKILCSRNPDKFEWIQTKTDDLFQLNDYHLVVGGFEFVDNRFLVLYIGRLNYEGSLIIGKVFTNESVHRGIKIPAPTGREIEKQEFELLVYKKRN